MFSPKAKTTRPVGKAAGYDYSQRRCGASDTSYEFFDSLKGLAYTSKSLLLLTQCIITVKGLVLSVSTTASPFLMVTVKVAATLPFRSGMVTTRVSPSSSW